MAQQRDRMGAQAEAHGNIVFDHFFAKAHLRQMRGRLINGFAVHITGKQRQGRFGGDGLDLPQRFAAA